MNFSLHYFSHPNSQKEQAVCTVRIQREKGVAMTQIKSTKMLYNIFLCQSLLLKNVCIQKYTQWLGLTHIINSNFCGPCPVNLLSHKIRLIREMHSEFLKLNVLNCGNKVGYKLGMVAEF